MERRTGPLTRALSPLREFLRTEAAGGALLVVAAIAAMVWANSPWQAAYESLWHTHLAVSAGSHTIAFDLRHWVNDGLMAVFFLVVGLEIKREVTTGHLAGRRAAALPIAAALGGMAVPAGLYLLIAGGTAAHGWGVPMATDIALAVGVLTLAGPRVPASLRAFLLGLAVVDDIGAIVVIAIFYSTGVSFGWLTGALGTVVLTVIIRRLGVRHVAAYVVLGAFLWFALHEAGVHPTLAGVVMGLLAPAHVITGLEHALHPWTSYLVVPVFALANAGIEVSADTLRTAWHSPITWGVMAGLLVGKPLGVLLATRLATGGGLADRPPGTTRRQLLGAGNAAGIGFTVALFIAELAFRTNGVIDEDQVAAAKMAILVASVLSGAIAFAVLRQRGAATIAADAADTIAAAPDAAE